MAPSPTTPSARNNVPVMIDIPEEQNPGTGRPGMSWTGDGALTPELHPASPLHPSYRGEDSASAIGDLRLASFGRRAFGYAIDLAAISVIAVVAAGLLFPGDFAAYVNNEDASQRLLWLIASIPIPYNWIFNTLGWSPGKRAVRLRLVDAEGLAPGRMRALRRTLIAIVSVFLQLGYIWAAFDRQTRTWHDRVAGTYVVEVGDDGKLLGDRE